MPVPRRSAEDAAEISSAQAEALLALTAGQVEYLSTAIAIGSHTATIQRFLVWATRSDQHDVRDDKAARKFQPPSGSGPRSARIRLSAPCLALTGRLPCPEVEVTNAALASLLDALDHRDRAAEPCSSGGLRRRHPPRPPSMREAEQELDQLTIEDSVIRDACPARCSRRGADVVRDAFTPIGSRSA